MEVRKGGVPTVCHTNGRDSSCFPEVQMSHTLILLTALSVAALAPLARAQTSTDSTKTEPTKADSLAPAAEKRGGGLFGRVKKIAGNKTVQGVAKGAACVALPGAAAVSAATGKGGCLGPAGMMGEGKGGVAGAVSGAAAGAVIGAVGSVPDGATVPNAGAIPVMPTGMPVMPAGMMMTGMPAGMKVNEAAAARCLGLTVQEYRDASNPTPDAAQAMRAVAVREKLMTRAQLGTPPADMQACGQMYQP